MKAKSTQYKKKLTPIIIDTKLPMLLKLYLKKARRKSSL